MAYNKVYEVKFSDVLNNSNTENWRADILDEEGAQGIAPISLIPAADPCVIEVNNTSDDKNKTIVGQKITLNYEYTGLSDQPLPNLFFDKDERRFQIKLYKDGLLKNTFFVDTSGGGYDDKYPPFTVSITGVDGLAFLNGIKWNAFTEDGLLDYRWMSLYEIMMERCLFQSLEETEANVICTLKPENIQVNSFLNGIYMHCDMFYDFVNGPLSCFEVLDMICKTFGLQIYTDQNIIWIVRLPDMLNAPLAAENYNSGVMNPITLQANERSISYNSNDAKAVNANARNVFFPAIKNVEYDMTYKSINQLSNFLWEQYDTDHFVNWWQDNADGASIRYGSGTLADPYRARIIYSTNINDYIAQDSGQQGINFSTGDIIEIAFNYYFNNTKDFKIIVRVKTSNPSDPSIFLDDAGNWFQSSEGTSGIFIGRSGSKRSGSFSLKSMPIPIASGNNATLLIRIYAPNTLSDTPDDTGVINSVDIFQIKLGAIRTNNFGVNIKDENNGRCSKKLDKTELFFFDTGIKTLSNTIAVDANGTPAQNWFTAQDANKQSIQRRTADGVINQYARTIYGWESDVRSNSINYNNTYNIFGKDGKKYIIMQDSYSIRSAEHRVSMQEALPDGSAETTYTEVDITDQNN